MPREADKRGAHLPPRMKRHRITSLVIVAAVIGLGLASRRVDVVHAWLGKCPRDALRFNAPDLVAYAVGAALAMLVDASRIAYQKRAS
jgi:hypothetical protein